MTYDTNPVNDSATGIDDRSAVNNTEEAVDTFNTWAGPRGYDATVERFAWGDWSIHVTLDDHRIATVYNDLDEFERVARRVDEGDFEPLVQEAAA